MLTISNINVTYYQDINARKILNACTILASNPSKHVYYLFFNKYKHKNAYRWTDIQTDRQESYCSLLG